MTETWLLRAGYKDSDHPGTSHARGAEYLLSGHNVFQHTWYSGRLGGHANERKHASF